MGGGGGVNVSLRFSFVASRSLWCDSKPSQYTLWIGFVVKKFSQLMVHFRLYASCHLSFGHGDL